MSGVRACVAGLALLAVCLVQAHAQPRVTLDRPTLVVGTMRVPPFVLRGDDGTWGGLSIDLWRRIATELDAKFELREYDYDAPGLMRAVERGQVDLAIAAIPMTVDAESRVDFSHPYFAAGLGIAVRAEPRPGILGTFAALPVTRLVGVVMLLLTVLLVVGALMWLLERRSTATQFHPQAVPGIGDGLWWAAVTMTTTGYGDRVPITTGGRALGLVWMFTSIFMIAVFSATMASSLVVRDLRTGVTGPADLPRVRVAAVAGSAGAEWLATQGLQARGYPFVIQASKALQRGDVEALVYERAILGHMAQQYGWRELEILPHTLAVRDYAIAMPADSTLREPINRALLHILQRSDWRDVVRKYVGDADASLSRNPS